ncbi:MDR family NADP-dependent oxidoreductase [Paludibacterium paludis]|uniref:NADP-dependent oxidoreductase n=1 Tax=Paludibacterium paludis TaxID=1225769 RepID=A0A918P6B2_9NEIS|nr:NADP-dependent oxidoreductase [Paludibacterium paludis]GGY24693.1 NADP-dependent oxidoreductase [Paludibacterium paludis]
MSTCLVIPSRRQLFHLVRRPVGAPARDAFERVDEPMPELLPGSVLVANRYLSVDPYMRECMDEEWELHRPLEGRSLGQVVASQSESLPVGSWVFHRQGWATHARVPEEDARHIEVPSSVPPRVWLGLLGGTGLTAYVALTRIAALQPGQSVLVNAAAGGVGMAAAIMARRLGAGKIVGCTGSADKTARLMRDGIYDRVVDYRSPGAWRELADALPGGADVALENVGGAHLARTIELMAPHGRIAWVGAVSQYNGDVVPVENLYRLIEKRLTLRGFLVSDHRTVQSELESWLLPALMRRELPLADTVVHGFEHCAEAFLAMLEGRNLGKMIVEL